MKPLMYFHHHEFYSRWDTKFSIDGEWNHPIYGGKLLKYLILRKLYERAPIKEEVRGQNRAHSLETQTPE